MMTFNIYYDNETKIQISAKNQFEAMTISNVRFPDLKVLKIEKVKELELS